MIASIKRKVAAALSSCLWRECMCSRQYREKTEEQCKATPSVLSAGETRRQAKKRKKEREAESE